MYLSPVHVFVEGGLINKGRGILNISKSHYYAYTKEMYVDLDINDPF